MDPQTAKARVLDAAEELFYGRGVQDVGMDEIRSASGVSLKRLYRLFPAKTKGLVFVDGALLYDRDNPKISPRTDFELGQESNGSTGGAGQ